MPVILRALTFAGRFIGTALRHGKDLPSRVSRAAKMAVAEIKDARAKRLMAKAAQARKAARADKASAASTAGTAKGATKSPSSSSGNPVGIKDVGKKEFRDALRRELIPKEGERLKALWKKSLGFIGNCLIGGLNYAYNGLKNLFKSFTRNSKLEKAVGDEHGDVIKSKEALGKVAPPPLTPEQIAARIKAKRTAFRIKGGVYGAAAATIMGGYATIASQTVIGRMVYDHFAEPAFRGAVDQLPEVPGDLKKFGDFVDSAGKVVEDTAARARIAYEDNKDRFVPFNLREFRNVERVKREVIESRLADKGIDPATLERYARGPIRAWPTMIGLAKTSLTPEGYERANKKAKEKGKSLNIFHIAKENPEAFRPGFRELARVAHSGTVFVPQIISPDNCTLRAVVGEDGKPKLIVDASAHKDAAKEGRYVIKADGKELKLDGKYYSTLADRYGIRENFSKKIADSKRIYVFEDPGRVEEFQVVPPSKKPFKIRTSKPFSDRFKLHEAQAPAEDVEPSGTRPGSTRSGRRTELTPKPRMG